MHPESSRLIGTWQHIGFGQTLDALTKRGNRLITFHDDGTSVSDPVVQKPPRPDTWRVETLASRKDLQFAFSDGDDPLLLVQTGLMPPMPEYGHDDWVGEEEVLVIHKLLKMKLVTKTIGFDDEPIFFNEYKRLTERQRADYNAGRLKLD